MIPNAIAAWTDYVFCQILIETEYWFDVWGKQMYNFKMYLRWQVKWVQGIIFASI